MVCSFLFLGRGMGLIKALIFFFCSFEVSREYMEEMFCVILEKSVKLIILLNLTMKIFGFGVIIKNYTNRYYFQQSGFYNNDND